MVCVFVMLHASATELASPCLTSRGEDAKNLTPRPCGREKHDRKAMALQTTDEAATFCIFVSRQSGEARIGRMQRVAGDNLKERLVLK